MAPYASGYVQINRMELQRFVESMPAAQRRAAKAFLLEGLLVAAWEPTKAALKRDVIELERGQFPMGLDDMAEAVGIGIKPMRTLLKTLVNLGEIAVESTRRGTLVTLLKYDEFTLKKGANRGQTEGTTGGKQKPKKNKDIEGKGANRGQTEGTTEGNIEEVKKDKIKTSTPLREYPSRAVAALEKWQALAPLPQTANPNACLKILDQLHRLDKLPWDRIDALCEFAARAWVPQGFIASPAKLRKKTRAGDMATWEAIERQMRGAQPAHGAALTVNPDDLSETLEETLRRQQRERQGVTV